MHELTFSDVSLSYKAAKGSCSQAVSGLSFSLCAAEAVALIGPSGCGKSSTLLMADGLLTPSSGSIIVDGTPLSGPREKTALILQDFGLLPWKSVIANAELGLKLRGIPKPERHERALQALSSVGLSGMQDRYPGELSGGQAQRLALARCLALDMDLLLMDEPLSALDALLREQLQETLLELWARQGYAHLLVTHSIEEAVFLGRRILLMSPRPGHIVCEVDNPDMGQAGFRGSDAYFEKVRLVRGMLRQASAAAAGEAAAVAGEAAAAAGGGGADDDTSARSGDDTSGGAGDNPVSEGSAHA